MSGRTAASVAFVDSNVLIYAVSQGEPEKRRQALQIVERGFRDGCFAISTQVLLEVYVNLTRRARMRQRNAAANPADDINEAAAFSYVRAFLEWPVAAVTPATVLAALELSRRYQISPWDAAIIETARQAGCSKVLTEDLGSRQVYDGMAVENPFAAR